MHLLFSTAFDSTLHSAGTRISTPIELDMVAGKPLLRRQHTTITGVSLATDSASGGHVCNRMLVMFRREAIVVQLSRKATGEPSDRLG